MYNDSKSTLQPGDRDSYYPDFDNQSFFSAEGHSVMDSTRPCESIGPPPIPPPHSVPLDTVRRRTSNDSYNSPEKHNVNFNRTPSPLRNAMDDVMLSLDSMQLKTPVTPRQSPIKDTTMEMPTPSPTKWDVLQSPVRALNSPTKNPPSRPLRPISLKNPNNQNSSTKVTQSDSDDDDIPFDPNSYNCTSPRQNSALNGSTTSTISNDPSVFSRTNTYRSISSINTNSLSIISGSTTPTTVSNMSTNSAGSLMRRKNEHYYKRESGQPAYMSSAETPVNLPGQQRDQHAKSTNSSLKLKKSTGFLKKLFADNTSSNGSTESGRSTTSRAEKYRLRPQKSQKSLKEDASLRSSSSLSLRETIRKVSGRSYSGRTALSSMDLRPMKSNKSIGRGEFPDTAQWIEIHRNVHRTNTLSKHEREQRKMRPQVDGVHSIEPMEHLSRLGGNETLEGGYTWKDQSLQLQTHDFATVDSKICNINSWPFMTPSELARGHIFKRFTHPLDQLRAAFDFCSTKLRWEPLICDDEYEEAVGSLSRVMKTRRATPLEIAYAFKNMCDVFSIRCNVIAGYLKGPGEVWHNPGIPRPNHYWNSVLVEGHWRMVDASLANPSFPNRDTYSKCDKRKPEFFYFLTRPCELVFTHVPYDVRDEHIVPPLSHEVLIALPVAGPAAFKFNLELKNFSTSLTRMQGLDIAELTMAVPPDVEILAEVVAGTFPAGSSHMLLNVEGHAKKQALSQAFWIEGERFYRIKALLPPSHSQGTLNIYVGPRGTLQSITNNTLSPAYSVPMIQDGENPTLNFVIRHPTPHSDRQDIYINEPQCQDLVSGHTYHFSVQQHPSRGNNFNAPSGKVKLAIQSPRGKILKLNKNTEASGKTHGVYEGTVKCNEPGTWRGLILADSGNAWSVYAEWQCA